MDSTSQLETYEYFKNQLNQNDTIYDCKEFMHCKGQS